MTKHRTHSICWMLVILIVSAAVAGPSKARAQRVHYEPLYSINGDVGGDLFGYDMTAIDDVDGDGRRDLIISAFFANGGDGAVYLYGVTAGGATLLQRIDGIGDQIGADIQVVGDVDGDLTPDFALGSPTGDPVAGRIALVSGANRTIGGIISSHPAILDRFDRAGSFTGETLGVQEGSGNIFVATRENNGNVYLIDTATTANIAHYTGGGNPFTRISTMGFVGGVGDVIGGDGVVDLAVTQENNLNGTAGTILIVDGSNTTVGSVVITTAAGVELVGTALNDRIGTNEGRGQPTVASLADLNGDTIPEIVVGAFLAQQNGSESGAVIVYDPVTEGALYRIDGDAAGAWFGNTVVAMQDLDSDGHQDFGVGARGDQGDQNSVGHCYLHSGINGRRLQTITDGTNSFCTGLERLSDLNGDGFAEVAISNYPGNVVHIYESFVCGDGVIDPGEDCDDNGESAACDDDCTPVACGDGVVNESAGEACDDGDTDSGDGCSATCGIETGHVCLGEPSACDTVCGDEIVAGDEECDGGAANSDSIPDACRTDCRAAFCGDGVVDTGEDCDDMNANEEDLCLASCQFNPAIPTVSQWGVAATALLLLIAGTTIMRRGAWSYESALE